LNLDQLVAVVDPAASQALQRRRGIGRWSAEYALLRGLGRLAVFPADDVGARNSLRRFLGCESGMDYEDVRRAVSPWAPYAGLVYFHLLLDHLERAGWLTVHLFATSGDAT
jgi:DNA-3-methyladenine glycosylase II